MLTPPAENVTGGIRCNPDPWIGVETNSIQTSAHFQNTPPLERDLEKNSDTSSQKRNDQRDDENSANQNTAGDAANRGSHHREKDIRESGESDEGYSDRDNLSTASTAVEESISLQA